MGLTFELIYKRECLHSIVRTFMHVRDCVDNGTNAQIMHTHLLSQTPTLSATHPPEGSPCRSSTARLLRRLSQEGSSPRNRSEVALKARSSNRFCGGMKVLGLRTTQMLGGYGLYHHRETGRVTCILAGRAPPNLVLEPMNNRCSFDNEPIDLGRCPEICREGI